MFLDSVPTCRGDVSMATDGGSFAPPHLVCRTCTALSHTLNCLPTFENWETMHNHPDFWLLSRIRKFGKTKLPGNIHRGGGRVCPVQMCFSFQFETTPYCPTPCSSLIYSGALACTTLSVFPPLSCSQQRLNS